MPPSQKKCEITLQCRVHKETADRVDSWALKHGKTGRSEAIRSMIAMALNSSSGEVPPWMEKLEALADRLNTDAAGAIEVLAEYVSEPESEPEKVKSMPAGRRRSKFPLLSFL